MTSTDPSDQNDQSDHKDEERIIAYARGELSEEEQFAFELRLSSEPALAEAYEQFAEVDSLADYVTRGGVESPASSRPAPIFSLRAAVIVAAAAAVLVGLFTWGPFGAPPRLDFEVAAVPNARASLQDYAREIGISEPERVPAGHMRGANPSAAEPRTVEEFLDEVERAERRRAESALAATSDVVRVEWPAWVTLRFRPQADCSAVVVELDSTGVLTRRYPTLEGIFGEAPNRFAAGETHVLPRPIVLANPNSTDTVQTYMGFATRFDLEVEKVWLILGVREEPVSADLLEDLDRVLAAQATRRVADDLKASAALAEVESWLRDAGFALRRVRVESSGE